MRSVFMSSSGDPFVLLNAMRYYPIWKDEIDELWICLNSTMEREVMADLLLRLPKEVKIVYINKQIGYGKPLNLLLELSPEGNVLLLEDDTIIFKKGIVDKYFKLLESDKYDLIGSPRMSCPPDVAKKLQIEFNLNYEGRGDKGCMFFPCFFWIKKELLFKTDRNFDPTDWGDTFAWMSVQLRRLNPKILEIPQYHCSPDDFINKENNWGIFDGECKYMHLGSLSSGIQSYLLDENQVPLADREANIRAENPQPIPPSSEMYNRLMWWLHCYAVSELSMPVYGKALLRAIEISGVKQEDLAERNKLYMEVIYGTNTND